MCLYRFLFDYTKIHKPFGDGILRGNLRLTSDTVLNTASEETEIYTKIPKPKRKRAY